MQKIFFSETDVLQYWGAYPRQTGFDTDLTGRTAASAIGVLRLVEAEVSS